MSVNIKNGRAKGETGKRERREHRVWVERGVPSSDVKNPGVTVLPKDHYTNGLTQDSTSERSMCERFQVDDSEKTYLHLVLTLVKDLFGFRL